MAGGTYAAAASCRGHGAVQLVQIHEDGALEAAGSAHGGSGGFPRFYGARVAAAKIPSGARFPRPRTAGKRSGAEDGAAARRLDARRLDARRLASRYRRAGRVAERPSRAAPRPRPPGVYKQGYMFNH